MKQNSGKLSRAWKQQSCANERPSSAGASPALIDVMSSRGAFPPIINIHEFPLCPVIPPAVAWCKLQPQHRKYPPTKNKVQRVFPWKQIRKSSVWKGVDGSSCFRRTQHRKAWEFQSWSEKSNGDSRENCMSHKEVSSVRFTSYHAS
jgi:hypothetical protein